MHKRIVLAIGWITLLSAFISMIMGHTGNHDLSWETNQISTYAAAAPRHGWITAAMILPCLALVCISILVSKYEVLGDTDLAHVVPLFAGAGISGLLTLAAFKETAGTMSMLKNSGFDAIRQQSFHDAGLWIFFYSAISLAVLCGILMIAQTGEWKRKILGGSVALSGLAAFPLMTMPWPHIIGILNTAQGLKQRASLVSLWLAAALVLVAASSRPSSRRDRSET